MTKHEALNTEHARRKERDKKLHLFIETLRERPLVLDRWDEQLWITLVEKGTVRKDGSIDFTLKNDTVI